MSYEKAVLAARKAHLEITKGPEKRARALADAWEQRPGGTGWKRLIADTFEGLPDPPSYSSVRLWVRQVLGRT